MINYKYVFGARSVLYRIRKTAQYNTYNRKTVMKQSRRLNGNLKPEQM